VRQAALIESLRANWLLQFGERLSTTVVRVSNGNDGSRPTVAELAHDLVTSGNGSRARSASATVRSGRELPQRFTERTAS
jgi:hypothetical protein